MAYELHLHFPSITDASWIVDLSRVLATLNKIEQEILTMSAELTQLTASVEKLKTADASLITLVQGIADQIRAGADDKAKMLALANDLDAESSAVTAAVLANTTPPPVPVPPTV